MRIGFFSAKHYDMQHFNRTNAAFGAQIEYFDYRLCMQTVKLAEGFEVVCAFVNDSLCEEVLVELANGGTKIIAMRCAGFNNVDLVAAKRLGMQVVNVPAYSPESVAEHTVESAAVPDLQVPGPLAVEPDIGLGQQPLERGLRAVVARAWTLARAIKPGRLNPIVVHLVAASPA